MRPPGKSDGLSVPLLLVVSGLGVDAAALFRSAPVRPPPSDRDGYWSPLTSPQETATPRSLPSSLSLAPVSPSFPSPHFTSRHCGDDTPHFAHCCLPLVRKLFLFSPAPLSQLVFPRPLFTWHFCDAHISLHYAGAYSLTITLTPGWANARPLGASPGDRL